MSTLSFPSRPEYSITLDFAIDVAVTITATNDFTINIATASTVSTVIGYGVQELDVGVLGNLEEQVVPPAARVEGLVASLPRLE